MFQIEKLKEWFWFLLNVTLVVLIILGSFAVSGLKSYKNSLPSVRTIYVSADGKTTVPPDIAKVTLSVVSEGMDPEKLSEQNNKKIASTIDFLKAQGIKSEDIKTANYDLAPRYEYNETIRKTYISGYTLTQTVFVKMRDFAKIGKILGGLPQLGINQIGNLTFDIENPDTYLNSARQQAFDKAFAKAKAMAAQNHVQIKRVVTFSENQGGGYPMYAVKSMAYGMGGDAVATPAPIESGSQEVTVTVNVTYEIE